MGLRKRYKTGGYVQSIQDAARVAIGQHADGTIEQQFYIGVLVAAQEAQHERPVPPDRQAFMDNSHWPGGYGWLRTSALIYELVQDGPPPYPYKLPTPPTEEELAGWGRPRIPITIWHESLDILDIALEELRSPPVADPEALSERLDYARKGFVTLSGQGRDMAIHQSLAGSCQYLILSLGGHGDDEYLRTAMMDATSGLIAARAFNPR